MNTVVPNIPATLSLDELHQVVTELDLRFYDEEILPHLTPERGKVNGELLKKGWKKYPDLAKQLGWWLGTLWDEPTEMEAQLADVLLHLKVGYFVTYPDSPPTLDFMEGLIKGALFSLNKIENDDIAQIKMEKTAKLFHLLLQAEGFAEALLLNIDLMISLVKLEVALRQTKLNKPRTSLLTQLETVLNQNKSPHDLSDDVPQDLEGAVLIMAGRSKKKKSTAIIYQEKFEYLRKNVFQKHRDEILLALLGVKKVQNEEEQSTLITEYDLLEILSKEELQLWAKVFDWVMPCVNDNELRELSKWLNTINPTPLTRLFILRRIDPDRGLKIAEILLNDLQRPKLSDAISQSLRGPIIEGLRLILGMERTISEETSKYSWFQLVDDRLLQRQVKQNLDKVKLISQLDENTDNLIDFLLDLREQLLAVAAKTQVLD